LKPYDSRCYPESHRGLSQDIRTKFLAKYKVKDELAALAPPKFNKELAVILIPSAVKCDEYQLLTQMSACLNAFEDSSGVSLLLNSDVAQNSNCEVRAVLIFFSEDIHLFADY